MMVARLFLVGIALLMSGTTMAASAGSARINYLLHCSGCHQQDGTGSIENGIPNMKGRVGHFLRTPEGRAFLVQVPGTSQAALNDADIAQLLNWMVDALSRNEVPANFLPYSSEEVARLRANRLDDVPGYRAGIVGRLKEMGYRVE
jgi:mono/diheme cytochrome c family protein